MVFKKTEGGGGQPLLTGTKGGTMKKGEVYYFFNDLLFFS